MSPLLASSTSLANSVSVCAAAALNESGASSASGLSRVSPSAEPGTRNASHEPCASLPEEERRIVQSQVTGVQRSLKERLSLHVAEDKAGLLAWLVFCSFFGYQQTFTKLEVGRVVDLSAEEYGEFLARIVVQGL